MDPDNIQLVRRLCCEAGSLMEKVSPIALIITSSEPENLGLVIDQLRKAIAKMSTIVEAAGAMLELSRIVVS